jgi:hypothetical protein
MILSISCVSCVIDSIGLPCAFGLVIFWYTIADSWRCRKYHIANSKLSVQFDSVQKTESYSLYIRINYTRNTRYTTIAKYTVPTNISVTIVPFEHMQIVQITINSVQKTESYTLYIRYKSYQFESIIYVPFSWYHFACAHCIVLMWHLNY